MVPSVDRASRIAGSRSARDRPLLERRLLGVVQVLLAQLVAHLDEPEHARAAAAAGTTRDSRSSPPISVERICRRAAAQAIAASAWLRPVRSATAAAGRAGAAAGNGGGWNTDMTSAIIASRSEARLVVAAERMLDDVGQALVAVGARACRRGPGRARKISTRSLLAISGRAIDTMSQSPRSMRRGDDRGGLEPAGADHRHVDRRLDPPRVGEVRALDLVRLRRRVVPLPPRQRREVAEQRVGAERGARRPRSSCRRSATSSSTGRSTPAGLRGCGKKLPVETWMASTPASSSHLQTWIDSSSGVARRADAEERDRVVVLLHADLHLQVEVAADPPRIARTISSTKRARFSSGPPYSSLRSLIAELRNCVIR